jgi:hypothetical protein
MPNIRHFSFFISPALNPLPLYVGNGLSGYLVCHFDIKGLYSFTPYLTIKQVDCLSG